MTGELSRVIVALLLIGLSQSRTQIGAGEGKVGPMQA